MALGIWLGVGALWFAIRYPHVRRRLAQRGSEPLPAVEDEVAVALPANQPAPGGDELVAESELAGRPRRRFA